MRTTPRPVPRPLLLFFLSVLVAAMAGAQPVAVGDNVPAELTPGMSLLIDVTANDWHPDGEAFVVSVPNPMLEPPAQGTVTAHPDGSLTLNLQDPGGLTRIQFSYQIRDSRHGPVSALVTVGDVPPGDGGCFAAADDFEAILGVESVLPVLANDAPECMTIIAVQGAPEAQIAADGRSLLLTPTSLEPLYFEYRAAGAGTESQASVSVTVQREGGSGSTQAEVMGVFGSIQLGRSDTVVPFGRSFVNPVVFAGPAERNGQRPAVVRITEVTATSFTAHIDDVQAASSAALELVSYTVLEAGRWRLAGSTREVEVNAVETNATFAPPLWARQPVRLTTQLGISGVVPAVLAQVQSTVGRATTGGAPDWLNTRVGEVSASLADPAFSVALELKTGTSGSHAEEETIGWLAFEPGQGSWGGVEYSAATGLCTAWPCFLDFGRGFATEPAFVAAISSFDPTAVPSDAHLWRKRVWPPHQTVEVHAEGNEHPGVDRSGPFEVSFLALEGAGELRGVAVHRPPQVPAVDPAAGAYGVPASGFVYQPPVSDLDPGDGYLIEAVEGVGSGFVGTLAIVQGSQAIAYTPPPAGFNGTQTFRYRVRDTAGMSSRWAQVQVSFDSGAQIVAVDDHYSSNSALVTFEGEPLQLDFDVLLANDWGTVPLWIHHMDFTSSCGAVSVDTQHGVFEYRPYSQGTTCTGEDTVVYVACARPGVVCVQPYDSATFTVRIVPPNAPPTALDDAFSGQRDVVVDLPVLANDGDPEGRVLSVTTVSAPGHGTVVINADGSLRYTPEAGFLGEDVFTYTVNDNDPYTPLGDTASVAVTVTRDLLYEDFHNDAGPRAPGTPLDDLPVTEGPAQWWGSASAQLGNGFATSSGAGDGAFGGAQLPLVPPSPRKVYTLSAAIELGAAKWAGIGFSDHETRALAGGGQLWVSLQDDGRAILRGPATTAVATVQLPLVDLAGVNHLRLEYDRIAEVASVWVNGARVLDAVPVPGLVPGGRPAAASFHLRHPGGIAGDSVRLDDFTVHLQEQLSSLEAQIEDGFTASSADRQPDQGLDRAWTELGQRRWRADGIVFGSSGTARSADVGAKAPWAAATVPFALVDFDPSSLVFLDGSVHVGDATGVSLGFSRAARPDFGKDGELYLRLLATGAFELRSKLTLLASGSIPGFDSGGWTEVLWNTDPASLRIWLNGTLVVDTPTSLLPVSVEIWAAGFEILQHSQSTGTAAVDRFAVGVVEPAP